eukprot:scaffold193887_cov30-Tisochrysis_lutea.AAC.3
MKGGEVCSPSGKSRLGPGMHSLPSCRHRRAGGVSGRVGNRTRGDTAEGDLMGDTKRSGKRVRGDLEVAVVSSWTRPDVTESQEGDAAMRFARCEFAALQLTHRWRVDRRLVAELQSQGKTTPLVDWAVADPNPRDVKTAIFEEAQRHSATDCIGLPPTHGTHGSRNQPNAPPEQHHSCDGRPVFGGGSGGSGGRVLAQAAHATLTSQLNGFRRRGGDGGEGSATEMSAVVFNHHLRSRSPFRTAPASALLEVLGEEQNEYREDAKERDCLGVVRLSPLNGVDGHAPPTAAARSVR